jgi:hypothetical protein
MRFLGWLKTQILVSDFTPKNEIALFEPLLEMGLRVSTHAHMKNLHLSVTKGRGNFVPNRSWKRYILLRCLTKVNSIVNKSEKSHN